MAEIFAKDLVLEASADTAERISSKAANAPGFWNGFDAYLFDIDGTLLRSRDRIHYSSFAEALLTVTGLSGTLDGITLHGNTDMAILHEVLRRQSIVAAEADKLIPQILDAMRRIVLARKDAMVVYPMPGVFATLEHLRRRDRLLGLGTGNLEAIGWLKTEVCGLRDYFTFGAFSDSIAERGALIAHGAEQARARAGSHARICVVGDTPADIAAAHANSLPVIAVATGVYSVEQLRQLSPEMAVFTLWDLEPSATPA